MKIEDFIVKIKNDIEEEKQSHDRYCEFAKAFEDINHQNIAQIYRDMAHEEELHSKHLEFILDLLTNHPQTTDELPLVDHSHSNSSPMVRQMEPINKPTTII